MDNTLVVGCSFVSCLLNDDNNIGYPRYTVFASPGSGNQAIAARAIYELSSQKYNSAVILWSGINRLDATLSKELQQNSYPDDPHIWTAKCDVGSMVWYHAGGLAGGGFGPGTTAPKPISDYFYNQYMAAMVSDRYLTELSLLGIISAQSLLERLKLPYKMGFIYDIHQDTDPANHNSHGHGKINSDTPLYNLVDWEKFTKFEPPYEWAKKQNLLSDDNYHPTTNAMIEWFKLSMDIDLQA